MRHNTPLLYCTMAGGGGRQNVVQQAMAPCADQTAREVAKGHKNVELTSLSCSSPMRIWYQRTEGTLTPQLVPFQVSTSSVRAALPVSTAVGPSSYGASHGLIANNHLTIYQLYATLQ